MSLLQLELPLLVGERGSNGAKAAAPAALTADSTR
jgi:hypothetical protein